MADLLGLFFSIKVLYIHSQAPYVTFDSFHNVEQLLVSIAW
jgi:hypothetical protein